MQYSIFQDNPVISENNIQRWAHGIALSALKKVLSYSYNRRLNKLYIGLINDIANLENSDWVFSDGYDLAQEAICFLCEYMGRDINEICAQSVRNKPVSIKTACYSRINQMPSNIFQTAKIAFLISGDTKICCKEDKMQQELMYEEEQDLSEYGIEEPYYFSPSITKKRMVNGKTYTVRSYYVGSKDFNEIVKRLATKQAYKNAG